MARTVVNHILATCRVKAKSGTTWDGEVAITSFRFGTVGVAASVPGFSDGEVTLNNFSVNDAATSSTTTHLDKVQGWAGDSGAAGGNVTDGDQDAIAEAVYAFYKSWSDLMTSHYTLGDIRLYPIVQATGKTATAPCIYTPSTAQDGNRTDGFVPENAIVLSWKTSSRGRVGHGKSYLGPVSSGTSTVDSTGLLTSYAIPLVVAAGVTLQHDIRAIGSIASERYYGMVWRRPGGSQDGSLGSVIGSVSCGDEMDTQQRRRRQRSEVYTTTAL